MTVACWGIHSALVEKTKLIGCRAEVLGFRKGLELRI